ncbi:Ribosomal protein [Parasponia andersonii]|uniref:Ribosomal protein n=1 Tax=Parasponia andersonii TaxID=3476 RepID=A0A2P5B362_PARAD|nr:Ribosomal protein [Parasponia andersonii]
MCVWCGVGTKAKGKRKKVKKAKTKFDGVGQWPYECGVCVCGRLQTAQELSLSLLLCLCGVWMEWSLGIGRFESHTTILLPGSSPLVSRGQRGQVSFHLIVEFACFALVKPKPTQASPQGLPAMSWAPHVNKSRPNSISINSEAKERLRLRLRVVQKGSSLAMATSPSPPLITKKSWTDAPFFTFLYSFQQFSIGVNEVTRVLERMTPTSKTGKLQAVLLASDSNPRWLTKHLPSLALSRKVPLIFFKDNKQASLRLGQLVKLKTAIAIGVKAKGNSINQLFAKILAGNDETDFPN